MNLRRALQGRPQRTGAGSLVTGGGENTTVLCGTCRAGFPPRSAFKTTIRSGPNLSESWAWCPECGSTLAAFSWRLNPASGEQDQDRRWETPLFLSTIGEGRASFPSASVTASQVS